MTSDQSLERFKKAQDDPNSGFAIALAEMQAGKKTSHWIWYVLPQLASLGRSDTARFYGIADLAEARAYLNDPVLSERLMRVMEVIAEQLKNGVSLPVLMGSEGDCVKLMSCTTLFQHVAKNLDSGASAQRFEKLSAVCGEIIGLAEKQGYARCSLTDAVCGGGSE
ncbi:hypothetical protein CMV30_16800 [Nibricoccus aquaticus]|uniref:Calpastatin n=1 Tax=Nibricoccus aquaticus TaxID=2576891 RepID=A0A290Q9Y9_9BACT|nr:DUF1810 family protein [Nibricoccus aquaticus]ATC65469.1 hypothetical protein CMV30_16800 [Nibricoccus aquaticus]